MDILISCTRCLLDASRPCEFTRTHMRAFYLFYRPLIVSTAIAHSQLPRWALERYGLVLQNGENINRGTRIKQNAYIFFVWIQLVLYTRCLIYITFEMY